MTNDARDAIALLKADHRKVEELFEQFEKARGEGRKAKLAKQICLELIVHSEIEEQVFYPACKGRIDDDLVDEAYVEHDTAKVLIADVLGGGTDEFYDAKVSVLSELIEHHVEEEERRVEGMFSQARKAGLDMDALGAEMAARKAELMARYEVDLPLPAPTTLKAVRVG